MGLRDIKGFRGALYRLDQFRARTGFAADVMAEFLRLQSHRNGARPSITAVVVGRNDDYMSDFAHRLRATIAWNTKYLADEVIFIEWNPPADRDLRPSAGHTASPPTECPHLDGVPNLRGRTAQTDSRITFVCLIRWEQGG